MLVNYLVKFIKKVVTPFFFWFSCIYWFAEWLDEIFHYVKLEDNWITSQVQENDCVIVITHEPNWLLDWYWNDVTGKNVSHLIKDYLHGRCKLRIAGDLHHYMRHSFVPSEKPVYVEHLLVNGCGGAFLHPTHVFRNFNSFYGSSFKSNATYPSYDDSSRVSHSIFLSFSSTFKHIFCFFPCF